MNDRPASDPAKQALERLARAEALTAQAQRIAEVGTWQFDTRSGLVIWSDELFRIFGVSPATFKPSLQSFMDLVHPADREAMDKVVAATNAGQPMDFTHRILRPSGEIRFVRDRAQVVTLEKDGAPIMVGTVQDITERRKAEETIEAQNAQLTEMQGELIYVARQSAMGTMAATLAHELNQPLTAISNYAAGLKRVFSSDPHAQEGLEQIERNAGRAGEIIRHLREMTRRGETERVTSDLGGIIRDAASLAARGACAGHELEYRGGSGPEVEVDPIQIGQVIINLVRNACEAAAGSAEKTIVIETSKLNDKIRIAVKDRGPGFRPDDLPSLFDGRISTKPQGMGIGLSISRTIVEAHGGEIRAENRKGGGACVWFTLPQASPTV